MKYDNVLFGIFLLVATSLALSVPDLDPHVTLGLSFLLIISALVLVCALAELVMNDRKPPRVRLVITKI
jgi:hypothetical protein